MIVQLVLHNWMCFRGKHVLNLGSGAYAIVARQDDAPRRSNGVGKSAIQEAIDYALTGRLRKERDFDADGWITHGEKEGSVTIVLDDGATIKRSKKIGQSRQVRFSTRSRAEASQDEADALILKHIAMTAAEFQQGPYVEQKMASRMVHAEPLERTRIVSNWLGLAKAEEAEKKAGEIASFRAAKVLEKVAAFDALAPYVAGDDAAIPSTELEESELRRKAAEITKRAKQFSNVQSARAFLKRHNDDKTKAKTFRAELESLANDGIATRVDAATSRATALRNEERDQQRVVGSRKKVALGLFDGQCPVAPIDCPAKKKINDGTEANRKALEDAELLLGRLSKTARDAESERTELAMVKRKIDDKETELRNVAHVVKTMADDAVAARKLIADFGSAEEEDDLFEQATQAIRTADELARTRRDVAAANKQREVQRAKLATMQIEIDTLRASQRAAVRAKAIFRVAARRVAEDALTGIEEAANVAIQRVGLELTVRARFEREGKDLTSTCDSCGAAFPKSAKVKACEQCGEPRGLATKQRLDFVMSDASGALWDVAGFTWQAQAAAWLLESRRSPWRTLIADEVTSACDAEVRMGVIRLLNQMVSKGQFTQLIFCSHDAASVDSLPHCIEITQAKDGSRVITVT